LVPLLFFNLQVALEVGSSSPGVAFSDLDTEQTIS